MSNFETNWTKVEFKTYLLLYFANADFVETEDEKELITSRVDEKVLKKIHKEFDNDSDYARIQKIANSATKFGYTNKNAEKLLNKIKTLFFSEDHDFGILEENMFRGLKHILT